MPFGFGERLGLCGAILLLRRKAIGYLFSGLMTGAYSSGNMDIHLGRRHGRAGTAWTTHI
jgi:hypothetical protein